MGSQRVAGRFIVGAVAIGLALVVVMVLVAVLKPQAGPQGRPATPDAPVERCGYTVAEAAEKAFGVSQVHSVGDGAVDFTIGGNKVVTVTVTDTHLALHGSIVTDGDWSVVAVGETVIAGWLSVDGDVVGLLNPAHTTDLTGPIGEDRTMGFDSAWTAQNCNGDPIGAGEYEVVAALAIAPGDDPDAAATAAVLSAPHSVRIDDPDRFADLGACDSAWPGEKVISQTDGWAIGLRLDSRKGATLEVNNGVHAVTVEVTVTNDGDHQLEGTTGHPTGIIVKHDRVVGLPGPMVDVGFDASLRPGESRTYERGGALLSSCNDGTPLPKGTYELYAIMGFFLDSPAGVDGPQGVRTDVIAVGGPWTFRVR